MDPKKREQLVIVLMPAAIVLLGYALFVYRGQQNEYKREKQRLESLSKQAVTEQDVMTVGTRVRFARREKSELQQQLDKLQGRIDEVCSRFGGASQQFGTIEQMTQLLRANDVSLISQSTTSEPPLSTHQKEVLQTIRERSSGGQLEYRELQLQGRYTDVLAFLQQLGTARVSVLPVSLELDTSDSTTGVHQWKIVIVM